MGETADVAVVGGGVLGLATAFELTERRLSVVLLESGTLGSGTTGTSFHWINASSKSEDETYHRFNAAGVQRLVAIEERTYQSVDSPGRPILSSASVGSAAVASIPPLLRQSRGYSPHERIQTATDPSYLQGCAVFCL
jgi:glycine/D-amino acid oxidase-like deaminating enzyme